MAKPTMNRNASLLIAGGLFLQLTWEQAVSGQPSKAEEHYQKTVVSVLSNNCFACHSAALHTAGLNLEAYRDYGTAMAQREVWKRVSARVSSGQMPPAGMPAPSAEESKALNAWIETLVGKSNVTAIPDGDPGRVTARRLNRAEYNNTVRDLLGIHLKPADEFPVDDAGYGFDNIGDVLTISPLLMEKYLSSARKLSRIAVFGEPVPAKPTLLAVFMPKKGADEPPTASGGTILPYSMRGAMYTKYTFPVDAEYEFRVRVINHRDAGIDYNAPRDKFLSALELARRTPTPFQEGAPPPPPRPPPAAPGTATKAPPVRAPRRPPTPEELSARVQKSRVAFPPERMAFTLDGKQILEAFIEGNTDYEYDRGAFVVRVPVKAGEHYLRASFPALADYDDPRRNINPDERRRMYVEFTELAGPYSPSPARPESYHKLFVCGQRTAACARTIIGNLAQRAYRRKASATEIDQLAGLVSLAQRQGDSFDEGIRVALQAVLMSPSFLFRIETDPKPRPGVAAAPHRINDYELASRLSYFLWSSMPDDELLRLAKVQTLQQPAVLAAQVKRMLADAKAAALVDNFAGQWLGIRNLDRRPPDPGRFQTTDDELLDFMHTETNLFVAAMFREDRNILDFIDAPFTYLNAPLAAHYGIAGVKGEDFRRVELTGPQRSGLLTQGSILTASSYQTRTSVVTRGKWVLENLLGSAPPPPPPDVPTLVENDIGSSASLRQKMEQHRANPSCMVCHIQMDPIGFGLENYDAAGAWRTHDGKFPVDASGTMPDGKSFEGAQGLKQILKSKSDLFTRNFTEKLMTYALGRGVERFDKPAINSIITDTASHDYRFSVLVNDIVNSKPFLMRSGAGSISNEGSKQ